jgi:hypothetical protein
MKFECQEATTGEKKESLDGRMRRIESNIALLKEKVGIRD